MVIETNKELTKSATEICKSNNHTGYTELSHIKDGNYKITCDFDYTYNYNKRLGYYKIEKNIR